MPSYDRTSSVSSGEDDWRVTMTGRDDDDGEQPSNRPNPATSTTASTSTWTSEASAVKKTTIGNILRGDHPRAWTPGGANARSAGATGDETIMGLKATNVTAAFKVVKEARECTRAPRIDIPSNIEDEYMLSMNSNANVGADGAPAPAKNPAQERSTSIKPVLDWLYISQGHLTPMQLADLSSSMALSRIHVIDVGSMNTLKEAIADGVLWMGANRLPSSPVRVAAYLNRLKHRFKQRFNDGKSIVIMTYSSSASYLTLHALALFFFMYCYMDQTNSRTLAASAVEKQIPPASILESGIEELAACGKGWLERVQIEWPYGAHSAVDICGEICGGWHVTRHLYYHPTRKTWRIQLWGLPPGTYTFKYVVDGEWCVDLKKPMISDEYGNDNNMATVLDCGGLERLSMERLVMDEWDGMAASMGARGSADYSAGGASASGSSMDGGAAPTVELLDYEYEGATRAMEGRKMVLVVPEAGGSLEGSKEGTGTVGGDAEARMRLARLGSLLLSYYKKIGYVG